MVRRVLTSGLLILRLSQRCRSKVEVVGNCNLAKQNDKAAHLLSRLQSLEKLEISHTQISDKAIPQLSKLKKLTYLGVSGTKLTKQGIKQLNQALPKCKILYQ